jgi:hypothetical protein
MTETLIITQPTTLTLLFPTPIVPTPSLLITTVQETDFLDLANGTVERLVQVGQGHLFLGSFVILAVFGALLPWLVSLVRNRY